MKGTTDGFVDHSILSFELNKVEGGSEIILDHEFPKFTVAEYRNGWMTCLANCETFFAW